MTNHSFDPVRDKIRQPRRKGRYDSAEAILKKIDEAQAEGAALLKEAEELDARAAEAIKSGNTKHFIVGFRSDAAKKREQANRKFEVRCKFLKEKLGVFRTELLPGVISDSSIPKVGSDRYMERNR